MEVEVEVEEKKKKTGMERGWTRFLWAVRLDMTNPRLKRKARSISLIGKTRVGDTNPILRSIAYNGDHVILVD